MTESVIIHSILYIYTRMNAISKIEKIITTKHNYLKIKYFKHYNDGKVV